MDKMDWISDVLVETRPEWSRYEFNRWADFIELVCCKEDGVSKNDIIDLFEESDLDNTSDRGGSRHINEATKLESIVKEYFSIIRYRVEEFKEFYPFEIEHDCLFLKSQLTEKNELYLYLLACSSIALMNNKSKRIQFTDDFEKVSAYIFEALSPIKARVEIFGTSREGNFFGTGKQRTRIECLGRHIGANVTGSFAKDERYDRAPGGDNGLDIVSFYHIDEAAYIPFAFAQCTCSYDKWEEKQNSICLDKWSKIFEPIVEYPKYMFVPFSCHNTQARFCSNTFIYTFLIDRVRIIRILRENEEAEKKMRDHLVEAGMVTN